MTSFEYRLHTLGPTIVGGLVVHPYSAAHEVLAFFGDLIANAPDPLTVGAALVTGPDGHRACILACAYAGSTNEGLRAVGPLKNFGTPLMDGIGPIPYVAQQALLEQAAPPGLRNYWKSEFVNRVTVDFVGTWVDAFAEVTSPLSFQLLFPIHGAAARVSPEGTAFPCRGGVHVGIYGAWKPGDADEPHLTWVRSTWHRIKPFASGGLYVNEMSADDGRDRARQAFGVNYERLASIKAKYDPDNVFRLNANIEPAAARRQS